jgi:hypothetical protein
VTQWLFLVDGIISLPIALLGLVFLPDMPENTRAWYFTPEEKAFAVKRMQLEGRKGRQPYTRAKFKKVCRDENRVRMSSVLTMADFHVVAYLRACVAVHHLQQRRICCRASLCPVSQEEQGAKVRSVANQRISYDDVRRGRSNDTNIRLELRHILKGRTLAANDLWCKHEYHHLRIARFLGHSRRLEVGLLYPRRMWLWSQWTLLRLGS